MAMSVHAAAAKNPLLITGSALPCEKTDNFTVMLQPLSVATRLKRSWTTKSTT